MKFQEVRKDENVGKDYYRRNTESYIDWLKVLVDRLAPYDVEIKKITEWQYRINGVLDLYPVNRRYHNIKTGKRGDYNDFVTFTVKYSTLTKKAMDKTCECGHLASQHLIPSDKGISPCMRINCTCLKFIEQTNTNNNDIPAKLHDL